MKIPLLTADRVPQMKLFLAGFTSVKETQRQTMKKTERMVVFLRINIKPIGEQELSLRI